MNGDYSLHTARSAADKARLLHFVVCANDPGALNRYLLASPCLTSTNYTRSVYVHAPSAAAAFNREMMQMPVAEWLVWAHQDVFLPPGWDDHFVAAVTTAAFRFPMLAVVGVYGIFGQGGGSCRAGHLLDRGELLNEPMSLPCRVNSIDELLFAVRTSSGLMLDPALGFDFYGTDLVLTAQQRGFDVAVVDAYCEHWSTTPRGKVSPALLKRVVASAGVFEHKWAHRFPVETPCFSISAIGDVERQCRQFLVCNDEFPL